MKEGLVWCVAASAHFARFGLLQAQSSLQRLFQLLPQLWKALQSLHIREPTKHEADNHVLDLTEDDASAQHASGQLFKPELLWMSTALEWGPLCTPATVMHWAEAMHQVSSSACTAQHLSLLELIAFETLLTALKGCPVILIWYMVPDAELGRSPASSQHHSRQSMRIMHSLLLGRMPS